MKKRAVDYQNVDEYISLQQTDLQPMLAKIRATIQSVVPNAIECISYMIPCYKYHGMLVGFGTHKLGCSFYTMNPAILRTYTKELGHLKYTGSTIHFDPQKPVPVALMKKIIRHRVKENEERVMLKKMLQDANKKIK